MLLPFPQTPAASEEVRPTESLPAGDKLEQKRARVSWRRISSKDGEGECTGARCSAGQACLEREGHLFLHRRVAAQAKADAGALRLDKGHSLRVRHPVGGASVDGEDAVPDLRETCVR